jgi:hypothetical protein
LILQAIGRHEAINTGISGDDEPNLNAIGAEAPVYVVSCATFIDNPKHSYQ